MHYGGVLYGLDRVSPRKFPVGGCVWIENAKAAQNHIRAKLGVSGGLDRGYILKAFN